MSEIFTFLSTAFPPTAQVTAFVGREALSKTYEFDIALKLTGVDVDTAAAVGARGTLVIDRGFGALPFIFHGILSSVELVNDFGAYGLYVARLVPNYWQLKLTRHSRIFTDASVPEIIEALLTESGLGADDYRLSLWGSYAKLEHVCQYRESNYDFIARLAEREGIYFYFEQDAEREILVFTDTRAVHKPLAPLPVKYYAAPLGDVSGGESLRTFRCKSNALPGRVRVSDYNYLKPSLKVTGAAELKGKGDIVLWGENVKTPDESTRYASIRAEELAARQTVYTGTGPQFYLRPGYTFLLEEHPRIPFNGQYLAVEVEHVGNQSATADEMAEIFGIDPTKEVYVATVQGIPHSVQYRAERTTAWPRIDGVVDGVVDGAADSPYAQIDGHGRYKVHIFFDEGDLVDGSRSTWVRMLQPHGGSVEGHHFPLRKQTEVHLVFLGGDPERPVIVGVAHNTEKPSVVTQANHTKNVIRSGSNNYLEMEDQLGSTHVHVYAPKYNSQLHLGNGGYNFDLKTDMHGRLYTGANHDVVVVADMTEQVGGSITETYVGPFSTQVDNAVTKHYKSTFDETVDAAVGVKYHSTYDFTVDGASTIKHKATVDYQVQAANTEKFHATYDETVYGKMTGIYLATRFQGVTGLDKLFVDGTQDIHVTGSTEEKIDGTYNLTIAGPMTHTISGEHTVNTNAGFWEHTTGIKGEINDSMKISLNNSVNFELNQAINFTISAGMNFELNAALKVELAPLKTDTAGVENRNEGAEVNSLGAKLKNAGVDVTFAGLNLLS